MTSEQGGLAYKVFVFDGGVAPPEMVLPYVGDPPPSKRTAAAAARRRARAKAQASKQRRRRPRAPAATSNNGDRPPRCDDDSVDDDAELTPGLEPSALTRRDVRGQRRPYSPSASASSLPPGTPSAAELLHKAQEKSRKEPLPLKSLLAKVPSVSIQGLVLDSTLDCSSTISGLDRAPAGAQSSNDGQPDRALGATVAGSRGRPAGGGKHELACVACISRREQLLTRLQNLVKMVEEQCESVLRPLFSEKRAVRRTDAHKVKVEKEVAKLRQRQEHLRLVVEQLRDVGSEVVDAVARWRRALNKRDTRQMRSTPALHCFTWEGDNYLLKMCSDLTFLDQADNVSGWLGFSVADNPLLLPALQDGKSWNGETDVLDAYVEQRAKLIDERTKARKAIEAVQHQMRIATIRKSMMGNMLTPVKGAHKDMHKTAVRQAGGAFLAKFQRRKASHAEETIMEGEEVPAGKDSVGTSSKPQKAASAVTTTEASTRPFKLHSSASVAIIGTARVPTLVRSTTSSELSKMQPVWQPEDEHDDEAQVDALLLMEAVPEKQLVGILDAATQDRAASAAGALKQEVHMVQEWERMAEREQQWKQEQHDPFARILECGGPQQLFDEIIDDAFSELGGGAAAAAALRDRQQNIERASRPIRVPTVTAAADANVDGGNPEERNEPVTFLTQQEEASDGTTSLVLRPNRERMIQCAERAEQERAMFLRTDGRSALTSSRLGEALTYAEAHEQHVDKEKEKQQDHDQVQKQEQEQPSQNIRHRRRRHRAATTLQRVYRGHSHRKYAGWLRLQIWTHAATSLQRVVRGILDRVAVRRQVQQHELALQEQRASTAIQSAVRGYSARRSCRLQRAFAAQQDQVEDNDAAADELPVASAVAQSQPAEVLVAEASPHEAAMARMRRQQLAAFIVQTKWRSTLLRRKIDARKRHKRLFHAATSLQRAIRGMVGRSRAKRQLVIDQHQDAAHRLQSMIRQSRARAVVEALKSDLRVKQAKEHARQLQEAAEAEERERQRLAAEEEAQREVERLAEAEKIAAQHEENLALEKKARDLRDSSKGSRSSARGRSSRRKVERDREQQELKPAQINLELDVKS